MTPSRASLSRHAAVVNATAPYGLIIALVAVFGLLIYPGLKPFPYSDEWEYVQRFGSASGLTLDWLLAPHVDHRIPLQKLAQGALLDLSGGDFRILVLANVAVLTFVALCWLRLAAFARGGSNGIGDAAIPLLVLSPGFNTVTWGFSAQFVASVALVSAASLVWVQSKAEHATRTLSAVFLLLAACALTGANGVVASLIAGVFILASRRARTTGVRPSGPAIAAIGVWGITNLGLMAVYRPSAVSATSFFGVSSAAVDYLGNLLKAWLGAYGIATGGGGLLLSLSLICIAAFGAFIAARRVRRDGGSTDLAHLVIAMAAISLCTAGVIALARSGPAPWVPGLELHYGFLVILTPLAAYLALLVTNRSWRRGLVTLASLSIAALLYVNNLQWRVQALAAEGPLVAATEAAIGGSVDVAEVSAEFVDQLFYRDSIAIRADLARDIEVLRRMRFWARP